jgi:hypothetical protein
MYFQVMNVVIEQIVEVNLAFYQLIILRNLQLFLLLLEKFPKKQKRILLSRSDRLKIYSQCFNTSINIS